VTHREYWIPAVDLEAFHEKIVGTIEVIAEFHGLAGDWSGAGGLQPRDHPMSNKRDCSSGGKAL